MNICSGIILCSTLIGLIVGRGVPRDVVQMEMDVKNENKLSVDKLVPPDHLDAVRLEQDGHINKDFHKEAFLGNHEEIDDDPAPVAESKLKEIFSK